MTKIALLATTALIALTGCSAEVSTGSDRDEGLDQSALEDKVVSSWKMDDPSVGELTADCEGGLKAEKGATQDCALSAGDQNVGMRVTATDDSGKKFDSLPFLDGDSVEKAVNSHLEQQGQTANIDCPDPLMGEVGETTDCTIELDGQSGTLTATVTSVDGLMIDFDYEAR